MHPLARTTGILFIALVYSFTCASIHAYAEQPAGGKTDSPQLERLKSLVGNWEGTQEPGAHSMAERLTVNYRLSAGGKALVETLFPGTPHEMLSVYHDAGQQLLMTHYCLLGNQPRLKLTANDRESMTFEFTDGTNMASTSERHMHRLKLTMPDRTHLRHEWTTYEGDKAQDTSVFVFTRKE